MKIPENMVRLYNWLRDNEENLEPGEVRKLREILRELGRELVKMG